MKLLNVFSRAVDAVPLIGVAVFPTFALLNMAQYAAQKESTPQAFSQISSAQIVKAYDPSTLKKTDTLQLSGAVLEKDPVASMTTALKF